MTITVLIADDRTLVRAGFRMLVNGQTGMWVQASLRRWFAIHIPSTC